MNTVKEIESAIRTLSRADFTELRGWLAEFEADAWDQEIAADAENGRLDAFYQSLREENKGRPMVALDEVLDHEKLS